MANDITGDDYDITGDDVDITGDLDSASLHGIVKKIIDTDNVELESIYASFINKIGPAVNNLLSSC